MTASTPIKGVLAGLAAIAIAGTALAQSNPPNPSSKDPAAGAGQQSTQTTPMGSTGTPANSGTSSGSTGSTSPSTSSSTTTSPGGSSMGASGSSSTTTATDTTTDTTVASGNNRTRGARADRN